MLHSGESLSLLGQICTRLVKQCGLYRPRCKSELPKRKTMSPHRLIDFAGFALFWLTNLPNLSKLWAWAKDGFYRAVLFALFSRSNQLLSTLSKGRPQTATGVHQFDRQPGTE
jgi:hypothetical protein